jgi:hypothetical protein
MMGQQPRTDSLFYYFRLEDQIPDDHLSRDQLGTTSVDGSLVSLRGEPPRESMTKISALPGARESKAICCPSGDQRGVPVTELKRVS